MGGGTSSPHCLLCCMVADNEQGMQLLNHFITVELSSFYLDVCKDRLYADAADSEARRACQVRGLCACRVCVPRVRTPANAWA